MKFFQVRDDLVINVDQIDRFDIERGAIFIWWRKTVLNGSFTLEFNVYEKYDSHEAALAALKKLTEELNS